MSTPLEVVERALVNHGCKGKGSSWQCPAHEDKSPSLSVTEGDDGRVLLNCHAGCPAENVMAALGLTMSDLFPLREENRIEAVYQYRDEKGEVLFEKVRFSPKGFSQRRPDGNGGYIWKIAGVRPIPYRLPQLLTAVAHDEIVFLAEGEKGADALAHAGLAATTTGGAKSWRKEHAQFFKNVRVVIVPDNDQAGREYARVAGQDLVRTAAEVRVLEFPGLPDSGDPFDFIAAGGAVEQLDRLAAQAPKFTEWSKTKEEKGEDGDAKEPPPDAVVDPVGILRAEVYTGERYPTLIGPLDELLGGGLAPGFAFAVAGAPGEGKTLLFVQLAAELLMQGAVVVVLAGDEDRSSIAQRIGQYLGFEKDELNATHPGTLDALEEMLRGHTVMIFPDPDRPPMTVEEVESVLTGLATESPEALLVLVVDSLQTVKCAASHPDDAETVAVSKIVEALRGAKKRTGAVVLATSEAPRAAYASRDPGARTRPIASFAGSRTPEFRFDVLAFIGAEGTDDRVRLEITKNRLGHRKGSVTLRLDRERARWLAIDAGVVEMQREEAAARRKRERAGAIRAERRRIVMDCVLGAKERAAGVSLEHLREVCGMRHSDLGVTLAVLVEEKRLEDFSGDAPPTGGKRPKRYRIPEAKT